MKTTRTLSTLMTAAAALAIPALSTVAAHASTTPTVVVMHRNVHNAQDEATWMGLAQGLSREGFRVISVAMNRDETAAEASSHVIQLLDESGYNDKVLLVGTASASEAISAVAQAEPARVQGLVYVSAADTVPTFGPRFVTVPASLQGVVPSFQVKVTNEKHASSKAEGGAVVFKVREQGHTTLGRTEDMVATINQVSALAKKGLAARG